METNAWRNQCNHRSSSHSRTISGQLRKPSSIAHTQKHRHHQPNVVCLALFDPPPFRPEKLTVCYTDEADGELRNSVSRSATGHGTIQQNGSVAPRPVSRRYTLTHNDITGALCLSVGSDYNYQQISGFYTRLLRDEVIAEWRFTSNPSLHIFCHVSGEERWLAPPQLRNYIFRRELPLVLETFLHADRQMLSNHPELQQAEVYVHFQSAEEELDRVELWGILGARPTWQPIPTSVLKRLIRALVGLPDKPGAEQEALLRDRQQLLDQYQRRTTQQVQESEVVSVEVSSKGQPISGAQVSSPSAETSQSQQEQPAVRVQQCSSSSSSQIASDSVVDYVSGSSSNSSVSRNGTATASASSSWQIGLNGNGNGGLIGASQTVVGTNRRETIGVGARRSPRPSLVVAAAAVVDQSACTAQQDSVATTQATSVYGGVLHPPQAQMLVEDGSGVFETQSGLQAMQDSVQLVRPSAGSDSTFAELGMSQSPVLSESRMQSVVDSPSSRERVLEPLQVIASATPVGGAANQDVRSSSKSQAMQAGASSQTPRLQVVSTASSRTRGRG